MKRVLTQDLAKEIALFSGSTREAAIRFNVSTGTVVNARRCGFVDGKAVLRPSAKLAWTGICPGCGERSERMKRYCAVCYEISKEERMSKKIGVCQCGLPTMPARKFCLDCIVARREERESRLSQKPCQICGVLADRGRKLCQACISRRMSNTPAPCTVCGKARPRERSTCVTCSVECAMIAKNRADALMSKRTERACLTCGNVMSLRPSELRKKYCSKACVPVKEKQQFKCLVCGKDSAHRKTCSDECLQKLTEQRAKIGVRSEQQRQSRRKHKQNTYSGKDKKQWIASLTEQQQGKCAICGSEGQKLGNGKIGLVLDHDHETGAPRAMLCGSCNAALGLLKESKALVAAMGNYIDTYCDDVAYSGIYTPNA